MVFSWNRDCTFGERRAQSAADNWESLFVASLASLMGDSNIVVMPDFSNAFNCVSRGVVLQQAEAHFLLLAAGLRGCYQQPVRLQFGAAVIDRFGR